MPPGGARPGAGRPAVTPYLDAPIMELLHIHTKGATAAELAVYMEQSFNKVEKRLAVLATQGVLIWGKNPLDTHERLYGIPGVFKPPPSPLTVQPPRTTATRARTGARTR